MKEVKKRGTPVVFAESSRSPISLCIHFTGKFVENSRRNTEVALKEINPLRAAELLRITTMSSGSTPALVASTIPQYPPIVEGRGRFARIRFRVSLAFLPKRARPQ